MEHPQIHFLIGDNMECFNVQIEVENNTYAVRHIGQVPRYFDSFGELTAYLHNYLPIYPVYAGGVGEATAPAPAMS